MSTTSADESVKKNLQKKVLIVEDDPSSRIYLQKILQKNGFIVDLLEDGVLVIKMLKTNKYDVVLMDIDMPKKNGIDCITDISEMIYMNIINYVYIIAITAYPFVYDEDKCLSIGFCDYISKPFTESILLYTLNYWLEV